MLNAKCPAPPSKSMMIRVAAASLLADGVSEIYNPSVCDDALAALSVIEQLGAEVTRTDDRIIIKGNPCLIRDSTELNCGESGLVFRMFSIIGGLLDRNIIVTGENTLLTRPSPGLEKILNDMGARVKSKNGYPPLEIEGPIRSGKYSVDGSSGSQIVSGLLFVLPLLVGDSELTVSNQKSKHYIDLTLDVLKEFGIDIESNNYEHYRIKGSQKYKHCSLIIEGDWSGAAFMLVAGAIAGSITVTGLNMNSRQPDKVIIDVLREAGAKVEINNNEVSVTHLELKAFEFNSEDSPDLFPALVAIACNCRGKSIITGANRLIHKESNRANALQEEFSKLGDNIKIDNNSIIVEGKKLKGGTVLSHGDHRIAMALAIAGLQTETPLKIINPDCVSKSYPNFFNDLIT